MQTRVGKLSERAFQGAIERKKRTSELRVMSEIACATNPITQKKKEM